VSDGSQCCSSQCLNAAPATWGAGYHQPTCVWRNRADSSCCCAGNGLSFITFVNTVPIDATRTINRFALIRNISQPLAGKVLNMDLWDKFAVEAMLKCVCPIQAAPVAMFML